MPPVVGRQTSHRPPVTALIPLDGATPTALSLPPNLTYEEWRDTGLAYTRLGAAVKFWIGDWLLYGEQHYGELMPQAAAETGYEPETLRVMLWVATKIPPEMRRASLPWSHHQVVAAQPNVAELLDQAEAQKLTVSALKALVRGPAKPKAVCGMADCPMRKEEAE